MAKEQKVYTKWLATKLVKAGNPVIRVEQNIDKPEFNVWVFAVTPKFQIDFVNMANSPRI